MDYKSENVWLMHGDCLDVWLMQGDCLERMKELDDNSVDSIVTDPPYGLSFMGKHWDKGVPSVEIWTEALRVLKPGGHLLAFAGTRTQHRMAVNIEDAGFEIRDMIAWVYGSGFPKSMNVSKAIDKAAGVTRDVVGRSKGTGSHSGRCLSGGTLNSVFDVTSPATEAAKQWDGWGTALKPALEPITVARKPFKGTVAANVLEYGTGALNIDGCRVGEGSGKPPAEYVPNLRNAVFGKGMGGSAWDDSKGRWPANLIHDGSDEVVGLFPVVAKNSAARFFYCAKASKKDRDEGLTNEPVETAAMQGNLVNNQRLAGNGTPIKTPIRKNTHPTVKPTDLMRYLCRLVTPPNGIVLDPFMGSGSTGKAAMLEGFRFIGVELDKTYFDIAKERIENCFSEKRFK
jgi:DNA modification methylase